MRNGSRRLAAIARTAAAALLALALATPASAQFGGLKRKLKAAAASDAVEKVAGGGPSASATAAEEAPAAEEVPPAAPAAAANGGTIVLDAEVVGRLIAGLKAAEAEREAAKKENTPYGRYHRAQDEYEIAQPKCEQGRRTFPDRMAANPKSSDKYNDLVEKMVAAQGRGDQKLMMVYNDSAMAMQDPACVIKQPQQPDDYHQAHRAVYDRAEQQALRASGYSRSDYSQARERAEAVLLEGTPAGDLSASERKAVNDRAKEFKPLLGIREAQPPAPVAAPAGAAAAPQVPASQVPAMTPGQQAMFACYAQNAQKNEARIKALGKGAEAAQQAKDMNTLMAIADTIQRIQSAGCTTGQ